MLALSQFLSRELKNFTVRYSHPLVFFVPSFLSHFQSYLFFIVQPKELLNLETTSLNFLLVKWKVIHFVHSVYTISHRILYELLLCIVAYIAYLIFFVYFSREIGCKQGPRNEICFAQKI